MDKEIKKRLMWIKLYEETGDAGLVCRRCGISRPTLRKWWRRYLELGETGLASRSRRPKHFANQKVFVTQEKWILQLRHERHLGVRRIQHELLRLHDCHLALATIQKVLEKHNAPPLKRKRDKQRYKRYQRPIPGDRVQMDTIKIDKGIFQYTAIDDCSRFLVVAVYSKRTAANTRDFIEQVIEQMPFPIQRFQTDNGREFTAYEVQDRLIDWGIKFRPIRPASPHLNGKVERVQQTILSEFYATIDLPVDDLQERLEEWQFYYNWQRVHGSTGKTPIERCNELLSKTPYWEDVSADFDTEREQQISQKRARQRQARN